MGCAKFPRKKKKQGGYFKETARDPRRVANPFHGSYDSGMTSVGKKHVFSEVTDAAQEEEGEDAGARWTELTRAASTNIFYLLSEGRSWGRFHRNKGRWVFFFSPSFSLERMGGILLSLVF